MLPSQTSRTRKRRIAEIAGVPDAVGNQGEGQDQEGDVGFAQERVRYSLGLNEAKGPEADDKEGGYDGLPRGEGMRYS